MIALAADHGGFDLKEKIRGHLDEKGIAYHDYGIYDGKPADYPNVVKQPADDILAGKMEKGVFICGTGVGISIAANKHKGIRAACVSESFSARLSREHNDANVLCMGGRVVAPEYAFDIVDAFLSTPFSNGERHARRIEEISEIEK